MNPIQELLTDDSRGRGRPPKLVPDSYHAEERDLRQIRKIARKHKVSKAAFIRACIKMGLAAYAKHAES